MAKVEGLDRLLRQMAAVPPAVRAQCGEALEKNAEELAAAIKAAAPRRSGELAESVDWAGGQSRKGNAPAGGSEVGQALAEAGLNVRVFAGNELAYWARWVEFGTAAGEAGTHKDAKGKTRTRSVAHHATPAEPFFWPTIRARKSRMKARVTRAGSKAAKAAALK